MRSTILPWLCAVALGIVVQTNSEAAGGRRVRVARPVQEAYTPPVSARVPGTNRAALDTGRYPRFQGAFHSRELQNIGVPTGDVGLRGNSFSVYPW